MKKLLLTLLVCSIGHSQIATQEDTFPVIGLCIGAPSADRFAEFATFVEKELAPKGLNTLLVRIDYNYEYESRPELRGKNPLTKENIKELVVVCKTNGIRLIPQINLLGHQSWHSDLSNLLKVYPEFDETPHVQLPEKYEWPNEDGLYCKSYCPLHPKVHEVVFDLVDEILDVFETKDFHAGMDEVFYLADDKCPRCQGKDPAKLFADEVTKISKHLEKSGARLWIWGDRLIDGSTTGIGMWEASMNNTARAVDMIPKSVVINDWHYERADPTPAYFAQKGFDVIVCPWRKSDVAEKQVEMMHFFRNNSTPEMASHFKGVMQTIWTSADQFMDTYSGKEADNDERGSQVKCFATMLEAIEQIKK